MSETWLMVKSVSTTKKCHGYGWEWVGIAEVVAECTTWITPISRWDITFLTTGHRFIRSIAREITWTKSLKGNSILKTYHSSIDEVLYDHVTWNWNLLTTYSCHTDSSILIIHPRGGFSKQTCRRSNNNFPGVPWTISEGIECSGLSYIKSVSTVKLFCDKIWPSCALELKANRYRWTSFAHFTGAKLDLSRTSLVRNGGVSIQDRVRISEKMGKGLSSMEIFSWVSWITPYSYTTQPVLGQSIANNNASAVAISNNEECSLTSSWKWLERNQNIQELAIVTPNKMLERQLGKNIVREICVSHR